MSAGGCTEGIWNGLKCGFTAKVLKKTSAKVQYNILTVTYIVF